MRAFPIILIVLIAIISAAPADAMSGKLGAQVSAISNKLTGELPEEGKWKGRNAIGYGLIAELDLAPDIAISFQPGYSPRPARQEFEVRGTVVSHIDYEINYLSLPLLVRVTGDPIGVRGFVTAGLDLNILLDASIDIEGNKDDITDTFGSSSLGALFGAGVMVPLGRNFLTLELRYNQGLEDIIVRDCGEAEPGLGSPSVKYRSLGLYAGFLFSLGGE